MPAAPQGVVIEPNGQSVVVTFVEQGGGTPTAYADRYGQSTIALPATVTTRTKFFFTDPTSYTVSCKVGGLENANGAGGTATVDLTGGGIASIGVSVPTETPTLASGTYLSVSPGAGLTPGRARSLPSYAPVTAAGDFDPRLSVYNMKAGSLRRARGKLGAARAGTGFCKIACLGHSMVAGGGTGVVVGTTDWPTLLLAALDNQGFTSAGDGLIAGYKNATDPRITVGSGWGLVYLSMALMQNSTNVNALVFTSVKTCTVIDIWYHPGCGPFTYSIDGGGAVAVTPSAGSTPQVLTISGLADTTHAISLVRTSGTPMIHGVDFHHATRGVRMANLGIGGQISSALGDSNTASTAHLAATWGADLTFIECVTNDVNGSVGAATFKTNMVGAITNATANGSDVVLIVDTPSVTATPNAALYNAAMYELADTYGYPLIDMTARWGSSANALANGVLSSDNVHPAPQGYGDQARAFLLALGL